VGSKCAAATEVILGFASLASHPQLKESEEGEGRRRRRRRKKKKEKARRSKR
jgi:hypothetical protein